MNIAVLAFWPLISGPLEQAEETFLRSMLRRNLQVRVDSLELASVREAASGARSALGPQLGLTGEAGSTFGSADRSAQQALGTAKATQWIPTGGELSGTLHGGRTVVESDGKTTERDTLGAQIAFTQPLLRGFGAGSPLGYADRQARSNVAVRIQGSRSAVLARLQESRIAFWNQLARQQVVAARQSDSLRTLRLLEASRMRRTTGSASDLDTLQAHAAHLEAVSGLLSARVETRSGWRDLLALSDTSSLSLPVLDSAALPPVSETPLPDSARLVELAVTRAPELAQAIALVQKAEDEKSFRRQDRLPSLDVTGLAQSDLLEGGWILGAKARLEWLLPNGTNRSRYRQALLDLHASEIRQVQARSELQRQIGRLVEAVAAARAQQDVSTLLARAQARRLAATEISWNAGRSSWTELVAARRDALDARTGAWKALASAKALEAELEARTGTGPERLGWMGE